MKNVLKFSGVIAAVLAIVSFILLLACPSVTATVTVLGYSSTSSYSGISGIFGGGTTTIGDTTTEIDAAAVWTGILAFVLILVALVIIIAGIVLPLLKVTALEKVAGILNLVAVICLILAGVFTFCEVPAFVSANGGSSTDGFALGAGWIFSGILSIVAGVFAILPAAFDFIGGKK